MDFYLIFKLVSSPIARVFRVVKKEEYTLYVSLILAFARSVGIVFGVYTNDLLSAVFWFSGANAIGYIVTYILVFKAVDLPIFRNIVKSTAVIIIVFFLFYLIRMCFNQI